MYPIKDDLLKNLPQYGEIGYRSIVLEQFLIPLFKYRSYSSHLGNIRELSPTHEIIISARPWFSVESGA